MGQDYYKKVTITNSCYLIGTANKDVGNKSETEKAVNKSFILNEFMQAGNEDENAWILYSSQNNGYPCIKELDN